MSRQSNEKFRPTGRKIAISALCLALAVLLPYLFHSIPNSAQIFCPIHIPVLLAGLALGWQWGLFCGMFGPVLCFLFTGMPSPVALPAMVVECAVYGVSSALVLKWLRTGKLYVDLYLSLIIAMLLGRMAGGVLQSLVLGFSSYSFTLWTVGYFVTGWPAVVIQLILLPQLIVLLEKVKAIPCRYPKNEEKKTYRYDR